MRGECVVSEVRGVRSERWWGEVWEGRRRRSIILVVGREG